MEEPTSQTDMPAAAVSEAELGKDTKRSCQLLKLPLPFGLFGGELGNIMEPLHLTT
jgi:hypothetical protein